MAISHEAEVQRQHVRMRVPIECTIGGQKVEVIDWSVAGLGVANADKSWAVGHILPVAITFPFSQFGLNIDTDAEVRHIDPRNRRAGLRFVNMTPRQTNMLRFVLDAVVSGELVDAGDVIEVAARHNQAQSRSRVHSDPKPAHPIGHGIKRGLQFAAAGVASAVLLGFVVGSVYDRLFVIPAKSAVITADLVTVPATVNGNVGFVADGKSVARGEPVAAIESSDGKVTLINSPCDCVVQNRVALAGDFVNAGSPLVSLRRKETKPYVAAFISQEDAIRIIDGATVTVVLANGRSIAPSNPRLIPASDGAVFGGEFMKIVLEMQDALDVAEIGQPARVYFETSWRQSLPSLPDWLKSLV